jgi:hypothetical protein
VAANAKTVCKRGHTMHTVLNLPHYTAAYVMVRAGLCVANAPAEACYSASFVCGFNTQWPDASINRRA